MTPTPPDDMSRVPSRVTPSSVPPAAIRSSEPLVVIVPWLIRPKRYKGPVEAFRARVPPVIGLSAALLSRIPLR